MATAIIMPKLGVSMTEGIVAKWLKRDGETVEKDEPIATIVSKKVTYQMKAPASGILRVVAREKETRSVGTPIAFITAPGEALPEQYEIAPAPEPIMAAAPAAATTQSTRATSAAGKFVLASPAARRLAKEKGIDLATVAATGPDGMVTEADVLKHVQGDASRSATADVLATSAARKLAEERGINLSQIQGSGAGGRITEADVLSFLERRAEVSQREDEAATSGATVIPLSPMRRAIADNMVASLQQMAQLTLTMEVDVTELVKLRSQLKAEFDLTYTDLIVKAAAKALRRHPNLNATLIGDEIHQLQAINIGIAVALDDGLIVPVVRNADILTLEEIAQEARRLAQRARDGSITVDEVTGGTFTITNLGTYGVDGFTPIINPPEVAILGVGRIAERVVIYNDQIARRSIMVLSLTIDHRIVDGAPGAAFLQTMKEILENPYRLLI